jgi:hypothetical protein
MSFLFYDNKVCSGHPLSSKYWDYCSVLRQVGGIPDVNFEERNLNNMIFQQDGSPSFSQSAFWDLLNQSFYRNGLAGADLTLVTAFPDLIPLCFFF